MKIVTGILLLLCFCFTSIAFTKDYEKVRKAIIYGEEITVGDEAGIVQSKIRADTYAYGGDYYGAINKGYYPWKGYTYIITYGPPKSGSGAYVVTHIEKVVFRQNTDTKKDIPRKDIVDASKTKLSKDIIISERRKYKVKVISFDAGNSDGSEYVQLKITNNSNIILPVLTGVTKRYDSNGKIISSSRAAIPVADLKPGEIKFLFQYPQGHVPGAKKITVEIEPSIAQKDEQLFDELKFPTSK
jgi:hypothetical protein